MLLWTDDRCNELDKLEDIVRIAGSLNSGSHFCEKVKRLERLCESINKFGGILWFINKLACEDRALAIKNGELSLREES